MRGEDLIAAAYLSLLIGCLIQDGERTTNASAILAALPNGDTRPVEKILGGFLTFQQRAGMLTEATATAVATVVMQLRACGTTRTRGADGKSGDE